MSTYDPLQSHRRLWNDPENILKENVAGTLIMHPNLVYLENCKAVLRSDYNKMDGKVRVIGGGALIDGPMYTGFVGPGMLTAAVLGLHSSTSSIPSSDSIFEVINHILNDEHQRRNGILMLVHDCAEYFLNFLSAKTKAESRGIPVRMVLIRDKVSDKLSQKPLSPRSPSGLLLFYKIAGAMSEEGKSLDEIYEICNRIIDQGITFSTGVYVRESPSNDVAQIEISRGDRLSDRDIKRFPIASTTTREIVETIINDLKNVDKFSSEKFSQDSKIALFLDSFGGFSQFEVNILVNELVKQLGQLMLDVEVIYSGNFHTSIEISGFHVSIFDVSSDPQFLHYLNAPTEAYLWPRTSNGDMSLRISIASTNHTESETDDCKMMNINNIPKSKLDQGKMDCASTGTLESNILLTAIEFACEAVIACAPKVDLLDNPSIPDTTEKCGTRLANISEAIKTAIRKKKFAGLSLANIMFQISRIFEQHAHDPQAELYTIFFDIIARVVENQQNLEACDWLDAFTKAINAVDHITKGTKLSDTLFAAKAAFCDAYADDNNVNIIHALGQAVCAAQKQTSHVVPDSGRIPDNIISETDSGYCGLAGAHVIGVWMRGAYEGIKLKYSLFKTREKRRHLEDFRPDEATPSKMPKFSDNTPVV